jgi:DNA polymerase I-like protein with 3'-5' exonuclease and polymerase domains
MRSAAALAREEREFIYFDLSQSEMRAAAYMSGDENFIRVCESGDVHSGNACILFPDQAEEIRKDPKGLGKRFRDVAKNAGFGILYSAEVDKIFSFLHEKGFAVSMGEVQRAFDNIHDTYADYYRYCETNLLECRANGYMRTALLGRIRWIGWHPKPGDVFNFPIQSFIADLMNLRLIELEKEFTRIWGEPLSWAERKAGSRTSGKSREMAPGRKSRDGSNGRSRNVSVRMEKAGTPAEDEKSRNGLEKRARRPRVVAQVHDALIIEARKGKTSEIAQRVIRRIWAKPIRIPHNGKSFCMPIDLKVGGRWSHFDGDKRP